jgi:hypothetical protein
MINTNDETIASPSDGAAETLATCLLHSQQMYLQLLASDAIEQCKDAGKTVRALAECIVKLNSGMPVNYVVKQDESENAE